jgi:PAS domain S-box-containing protein
MSGKEPSTASARAHSFSTWRHYRAVRQAAARFVRTCAAVPIALGLVALLGWAFDIPRLRSVFPGAVEMKANTAAALVTAGVALLLHAAADGHPRRRTAIRVAQFLGLAVCALGMATAIQYLLGIDLRIDQALVRDTVAAPRVPGRMSVYSTAALSLLGAALATFPLRRLRMLTMPMAAVAAMIGLSMLTVHAWGVARLRTDEWAAPIAFATSIAFMLLGAGIWVASHRFAPGRRSLRVLFHPLELKIVASYLGALVALTTVGGLAYGAAAQYAREVERLGHIRQMRGDLTELYASVADAVFVQRTLVLSDVAGEHSQGGALWPARRTDLERIRRTLASYPQAGEDTRSAVDALDRAVAGLDGLLQHAIDLRAREGPAAARAFVRSGGDAAAMAELRGAMANMDAIARDAEESSAGLLGSSRERTVALTVLSLALAALLLAAVFGAIRREMAARAGAERALRRSSAEATAANRFLESLIQNIPHMIFVKDARTLRFVRLNRAGEQLTGLSQATVVGKGDHDFFPREEADFFVAKDREVLASKEILDIPEEEIQTPNQGVRLLHTKKIPLLDDTGQPSHLLGIAEDVTEARAAERQIELLVEALSERAHQVERASQARSNFLAIMSHEIRTPMNGMLGMLELLSLGALDERQREMLDVVSESGQSLLRIIDDILDFSKIEAGRLELREEAGSVARIVREVREIHAPLAAGKGLRIAAVLDPRLAPASWVDPVRLRQILNNFVGNAVKFTSEGHVEIRADVLADDQGSQSLRLSVMDTGVGIAPEEQARLFEPFVQATTDSAAGGTGLGLVISRRLAAMMGGTVHLTSEPGKGTTLVLELELRKAPAQLLPRPRAEQAQDLRRLIAQDDAGPRTAQAPAAGASILIVDDHPVNRELLQQQVEALGYAARTAVDGSDALAQWRAGGVSLVLTDCQMPRMSGYELARQIRAREAAEGTARAPIVACTAMALGEEREKCLAAGMDDVLFKPVELRRLFDVLQRWCPRNALPPQHPAAIATGQESHSTLDASLVAATWGPDPKTLEGIAAAYLQSVRDDHARLRAAAACRDAKAVRELAHRMLGASSMVGATGIAESCMQLTAASRDARWDDLQLALEALGQEQARLEAEFGGPS